MRTASPHLAARKATVALVIGALALSACGGGTATSAPTTAAPTSAPPSVAASTPPATTQPSAAPSPPAASSAPAVDLADLKIGAPYTLQPLDKMYLGYIQLFKEFWPAMPEPVATGLHDVEGKAYLIVVRFPDLPLSKEQILDQLAGAGPASIDTEIAAVETITIGGEPARVVTGKDPRSNWVLTFLGDDLLFVIGYESKQTTVDIATSIAEAN